MRLSRLRYFLPNGADNLGCKQPHKPTCRFFDGLIKSDETTTAFFQTQACRTCSSDQMRRQRTQPRLMTHQDYALAFGVLADKAQDILQSSTRTQVGTDGNRPRGWQFHGHDLCRFLCSYQRTCNDPIRACNQPAKSFGNLPHLPLALVCEPSRSIIVGLRGIAVLCASMSNQY